MCSLFVKPQNISFGKWIWSQSMKYFKTRSKFHEKWPFFAIIFLLIISARDDLVKVSWKSDARKCQNQPSPPYFYQLSERSQSLSAISYVSFSAICDFPLFSRKMLYFPWKKCLANNKFLVSRLPGSTFSTALNAKGTMVPGSESFRHFQQLSTIINSNEISWWTQSNI